jgi:hypothetical protein
MPQSTCSTYEAHTPNSPWRAPVRVLHWLIATSMAGATFLTSQGEIGHTTLGWVALCGLLIRVVALNMSGLLAAPGAFHLGATLVVLVITAFYCATVVFELLQRVGAGILATE